MNRFIKLISVLAIGLAVLDVISNTPAQSSEQSHTIKLGALDVNRKTPVNPDITMSRENGAFVWTRRILSVAPGKRGVEDI